MSSKNELVFGCDPDDMMAELAEHITAQGLSMVLLSMLSDVQEMVAGGNGENARQALNRVKYVIGQQMPRRADLPADVAIHGELGLLRALHANTTPGIWHVLPGRSLVISGTLYPSGYQGFDVLRGHAPKAPQARANAELSARLHNAAPALLDAAQLVEHVLSEQDKLPRAERDGYIVDRAHACLTTLKQSMR